nr:hypothetical protein [Tanacetum cinerariifolium]
MRWVDSIRSAQFNRSRVYLMRQFEPTRSVPFTGIYEIAPRGFREEPKREKRANPRERPALIALKGRVVKQKQDSTSEAVKKHVIIYIGDGGGDFCKILTYDTASTQRSGRKEVARAIQAAMPAILEENAEITFKMIEDRIGVHKEEKQVNEDVVVVENLLSVMTGTSKKKSYFVDMARFAEYLVATEEREVVEAAQDIENIIDKANNDIKRKQARSGENSNNKTGKKTPWLYIGDAVSTLCMHEHALVTSTRRMKMHLSLCVDEDLQHTLSFLEMIQARRR